MKLLTPILQYFALAGCLFLLQGCGLFSASQPILTTSYQTDEDVNPDINGRPSPLVVNIYQLKSLAAFEDSDFFSLYQNAKVALGGNLVYEDQLEIKPVQKLVMQQSIRPETKFIAFIAAYRDIDNANWRAIIPIDKLKKHRLTVILNPLSIDLKTDGK